MQGEFIFGKIRKTATGNWKVILETPNERFARNLFDIVNSMVSLDYKKKHVDKEERKLEAFIVQYPN